MRRPREGSRKAQVFEFFLTNSYEDTTTFGISIGLAEGTVRSWMGRWAKDNVPLMQKPRSADRNRVFPKGDPERHGTVLKHGDEVSEVRWDDGRTQFINNDNLVEVKGDQRQDSRRDRKDHAGATESGSSKGSVKVPR